MLDLERISKLIRCGLASDAQMEEAGFDAVVSAKSNGTQVLTHAADIKPGSYRFLLSTETPDRRGDIVRQAGLDLRNYRANPVVLLNHDGEGLPIGTGVLTLDGTRTWMDVQFSDANPMARVVRGMTDEGMLKASSISILPRRVDPVKEPERRKTTGVGKYGVIYEESEVLEGSVVTLPMNPEAVRGGLSVGVEKGLFSAEDAEAFGKVAQPTERDLFKRMAAGLVRDADPVATKHGDEPAWLAKAENIAARIERAIAAFNVKQAALARGVVEQDLGAPGGAGVDLDRIVTALVNKHLRKASQ